MKGFLPLLFLYLYLSIQSTCVDASTKEPSVVIIGSYRKFYPNIYEKIESFEKLGIKVLKPPKSRIINPGSEYCRFESDMDKSMNELEHEFLEAIRMATFVYVVNPNGYIGLSSSFEIGFSYSLRKDIYCMEKPIDPMLATMCTQIAPDLKTKLN